MHDTVRYLKKTVCGFVKTNSTISKIIIIQYHHLF